MSGYLLRLARQSGMKLARGLNSEQPAAPNTQPGVASSPPLPPAEVIEQNALIETTSPSPPSTYAPNPLATPADSSAENLRTATADGPGHFAPNDPRSDVLSAIGSPDPHVVRDAPHIDDHSLFETQPKGEAESSHRGPTPHAGIPARPHRSPAAREPTSTEVIQEVMAWIASDSSPVNPLPIEAPASANASSIPDSRALWHSGENAELRSEPARDSRVQDPSGRGLPMEPRSAVREPEAGATSVHIGLIQLTIEAPPEASPRVSSTPAPVAAPRTVGSRLRRHYLRPF